MRPIAPLLVLGLLPLALVACGGGGGSTAPAPKAAPEAARPVTAPTAKAVTIKVTSVVSGTKAHDKPPKGTSQGDRVEFSDVLLNTVAQFGKRKDEQVGTDSGTMTFTGTNTAKLEGEAKLPDGKILFSGEVTVSANDSVTVPVTGGTGKYENASGTLLVGSGSERSANTYTLVLSGVPGPVA